MAKKTPSIAADIKVPALPEPEQAEQPVPFSEIRNLDRALALTEVESGIPVLPMSDECISSFKDGERTMLVVWDGEELTKMEKPK